jgi:RNA recognition motif-containing protein
MDIYVQNLSPTTSREELIACFEEYGAVSDGSVSTYTVEGRFRASGCVDMPSDLQAQAAIEGLRGKELAGNLLKIHKD